VIYEQLKYEQQNSVAAATAFQSYSRNAYAFTATHEIGPGTFRGLYARAQSGKLQLAGGGECLASGLGARQYSLGYSYTFSKRTDLYGFYTRVANDPNATYQFANAAGIGAAAGAANVGYLLGIAAHVLIAKSPLSGAVVCRSFFCTPTLILRRRKPLRMFSFR